MKPEKLLRARFIRALEIAGVEILGDSLHYGRIRLNQLGFPEIENWEFGVMAETANGIITQCVQVAFSDVDLDSWSPMREPFGRP